MIQLSNLQQALYHHNLSVIVHFQVRSGDLFAEG